MHTALSKGSVVILGTAMFFVASVASASTVVVTGNTSAGENQPGWLFNRDTTTASPYEFTTAAHSIGSGSLYVLPIATTSSNKFIAEDFINAPVADFNSISYDFEVGAGGDSADSVYFYMNVYANFGVSDDLKFYDCRYSVVPTFSTTTGFTTVTFDPTKPYSVTTRGGTTPSPFPCPAIPADMDTLSASSTIRMVALNVGDTSDNDAGLDGYLDNVVVNRASGTGVYDFERDVPPPPPSPNPANKDDCKNGGYKIYGFKTQGLCIQYLNTGKDSRLSVGIPGLIKNLLSWLGGGLSQLASTIVPGQQKQIQKNINSIDSDGNNYPDVGKIVTGKYVSIYAYDAQDQWYWDLGDGRINGTVGSIAELDQATLTACKYQVQYRGAFDNNPFLDSGWILNDINCKGYDDNSTYNYLIVHETDPRYRGNLDFAVWGTWEYKVLTQSGFGNFVRPEHHIE